MNQVEAMQMIRDFEGGRYTSGYVFNREQIAVLINSAVFLNKVDIVPMITTCESELKLLMSKLGMPTDKPSTTNLNELLFDIRTVRKQDLIRKLIAKNQNAHAVVYNEDLVNFIYPVDLNRNSSDYLAFIMTNPDIVTVFATKSPHQSIIDALRPYETPYIVDLDIPHHIEQMNDWLGII